MQVQIITQLCISGNNMRNAYWVKNARIRSYSGPYFPAFGRNKERYGVSFRIKSE